MVEVSAFYNVLSLVVWSLLISEPIVTVVHDDTSVFSRKTLCKTESGIFSNICRFWAKLKFNQVSTAKHRTSTVYNPSSTFTGLELSLTSATLHDDITLTSVFARSLHFQVFKQQRTSDHAHILPVILMPRG